MTASTEPLDRADKRLALITWILGALCVALLGLGVWGVHLTQQQNQSLDDIQASRIEVTWNNCRSQNMRNVNTKHNLDVILARVPASKRARVAESRAATVLLIDALAPHQDCAAQLRKRFGVSHP